MMDFILDPQVHELAIMKLSQVGYSGPSLSNVIGHFIDADPNGPAAFPRAAQKLMIQNYAPFLR